MATSIGGATLQQLVACNRCAGSGIWKGPRSSGVCFACSGTGLLEARRAEAYLARMRRPGPQPENDPAEEAMARAMASKAKAESLGWVMQDPVALSDRVELLGRNPRRPGKTVHLTWVISQRTRHQEWLEGPPSKHRDLLAP